MHGRIEVLPLDSKLLRQNPLGDPAAREVIVYLPPGYDDGGTHYPTITMLPGFGSNHRTVLNYDLFRPNTLERFDSQIAAGESGPAIIVLPDATTRFGGSQFLDSPATGPYQSYLVEEVLPLVDRTLRTVPNREGRGVIGKSSGGFGALRLGMDRPEHFSVLGTHAGDAAFDVSLRPLIPAAALRFEQAGGIVPFLEEIRERGPTSRDYDPLFFVAAMAAYAGDDGLSFPHFALPFDPVTLTLDVERWERICAHDPIVRAPNYAEALQSMTAIFVDAGRSDEYGLQFAARSLRDAFERVGATVHYDEFDGGHRGTSYRYETSLPWIVERLAAR